MAFEIRLTFISSPFVINGVMIFKFRNVGIIEIADIEVRGLTVLTGLNDSGKSFISKLVYSIIKTLKSAGEQDINEKVRPFDLLLRAIYGAINEQDKAASEETLKFRNDIVNRILQSVSQPDILENVTIRKDEILGVLNKTNSAVSKQLASRIESAYIPLRQLLLQPNDENNKYKKYFNKRVIEQLFRGQINNLSNKESKLEIALNDISGAQHLRLSVVGNKIIDFVINNEYPIFYQDATLIESPITLQLSGLIQQEALGARVAFRANEANIPFYYPDLVRKMSSPQSANKNTNDIYDNISDIIGGKVTYNEEGFRFIFEKNNGNFIEANNIATGIKSFGLLQLLLNGDSINTNSILIIDEPEVHLHPIWEIEYAKIIILLVKSGIPIIISTHSPYFIKALTTYSKTFEILENDIKVYFAKKNESGTSRFDDISNELDPFLNTLAEPMNKLFEA